MLCTIIANRFHNGTSKQRHRRKQHTAEIIINERKLQRNSLLPLFDATIDVTKPQHSHKQSSTTSKKVFFFFLLIRTKREGERERERKTSIFEALKE